MSGPSDNEHSSDGPSEPSEGLGERLEKSAAKTEAGVAKGFAKKFGLRLRFGPIVWRTLIYGVIGVAIIVAVSVASLKWYVNSARMEYWIKKLAHQETGGTVYIGATEVNILTGLSLAKVKFFPPIVPDANVTGGNLESQKVAAFECDRIEISYSLTGLFAGQINIKALKLFGPKILLETSENGSNLDGIRKYRESIKSDEKEIPEPESARDNGGPNPLKPLLGKFRPGILYMPLRILARNIGLEKLVLESREKRSDNVVKTVRLSGVSVDLGLFWHEVKSRLGITIGSQSDEPMRFSVSETHRINGEDKESVSMSAEASVLTRLAIEDLTHVELNFAARLHNMIPDHLKGGDVSILSDTSLSLDYEKTKLDIHRSGFEVLQAFSCVLNGHVRVLDLDSKTFAVNINNKTHLDIGILFKKIAPLVGGVKASGRVDIDQLTVDGVIHPNDMANLLTGGGNAPTISGSVNLEEIFVEMQKPAIRIAGLNGSLKFGGAKALTGGGFGLDDQLHVNVDLATVSQEIPGQDTITIEARDVGVESTARFVWPKVEAQMARLGVAIEELKVEGRRLKGWKAPLYLEVSGDGDKEWTRNSASLNLEWKGLFELATGVDCHSRCARFRADVRHKIASIEGLYGAFAAAIEPKIPTIFIPSKVGGSLDVQLDVQGKTGSSSLADLEGFLREGDVDLKARLALNRFDLKIPMNNLDLRGFGLRVDADGNILEQHLAIETKVNDLKMDLDGGKKVPTKPIEGASPEGANPSSKTLKVSGVTVGVDATNAFRGRPTLSDIVANARTEIALKASLTQLEKGGVPIQPASFGKIHVELVQEALEQIEIGRIEANLPQVGLGLLVRGKASLDKEYLPIEFGLDTKVSMSKGEALNALPGISSQGALTAALKLSSPDMKRLNVNGLIDFERFGLSVADQKNGESLKFVLEDMNGQIPIAQSLLVPLGAILRERKAIDLKNNQRQDQPRDEKTSIALDRTDQAKLTASNTAPSAASEDVADVAAQYLKGRSKAESRTASKAPSVDYGSVKGFFPNRKPLTIKKLIAANIETIDTTLDVEWREDMVGMNEFATSVLGGQLQGNLQISLCTDIERMQERPKDLASYVRKINTNIQATRLDTRKIVERIPGAKTASDSKGSLFSNPYIDATVHYLWNLENRDLGGSIDITTIGKEQVRMLLSYIDPSEEDQTINDIRKGLYLGEVRQVSIPIKNGEIGLDVDIRALSVPIPTPKLSRFPISQLLNNAMQKGEKKSPEKGSAA